MPKIALLGSKSTHGGVVITATGGFTCDGIEAALDGDLHRCPIKGHGTTNIKATSIVTDNGIKIARVGDSVGCGAVITTGYNSSDSD